MPARPVSGQGQGQSRRRRGREAPALSLADHRSTSHDTVAPSPMTATPPQLRWEGSDLIGADDALAALHAPPLGEGAARVLAARDVQAVDTAPGAHLFGDKLLVGHR